jgi:hypothetical protein
MKKIFSVSPNLIIGLLIIGGVFLLMNFHNSDDPRITKIINQLNLFTGKCNLQKVYVHTDKSVYITGESIWLKAYILNATTFQPDGSSNEIFIDLIDRNKVTVQSIILQNNMGYADGDISLSDSLADGNYQLVAYTNWMKNFDQEFFFSSTIKIQSPQYEKYVTTSAVNEIKDYNQQIHKSESTKMVQFFPEGGSLVAGLSCRIAFKAMNKLGLGISATGEIFDDSNTKIAHFETKYLGMGAFSFTPEQGHQYYANVTFKDGKTEKFKLPVPEVSGYTIMANAIAGDQIRIAVQANIKDQGEANNNEIIVVAQSRGIIQYISKGSIKGKPLNASFSKKLFPAGIAQITIFNGSGEPVCERLVFIQPKESAQRDLLKVTSKTVGDEIIYQLHLDQTDGKHKSGNLSFSIYEAMNNDENNSWKENILSNLLLTSDIKGKVENAAEYFKETNPEAMMNLDYVMMINGWRRFVWKDLLAGYNPILLYTPSEGITSDEISTSNLKPYSIDISSKSYAETLNENFNSKIVHKNTKKITKNQTNNEFDASSNIKTVNHKSTAYSDMVQYLKGRVAGVTVSDNGIRIRNSTSFVLSSEPLILQDGTEISFTELKNTSPNDVASVEVLKGPDASLYGVRGANGVLMLHMRKGTDYAPVKTSLPEPQAERIISFYKSREFYVPTYDAWTNKPADYHVPRSVFWKPNVVIDSTGQVTVKVKNRFNLAKTTATIEGMASDGSILYYVE